MRWIFEESDPEGVVTKRLVMKSTAIQMCKGDRLNTAQEWRIKFVLRVGHDYYEESIRFVGDELCNSLLDMITIHMDDTDAQGDTSTRRISLPRT